MRSLLVVATLVASCSKQADAKGLHGKARKHFRSECKKHLMQKS
jgi:hypothetical protein